jgi:uncharacterized protein YdhG (YjbR/CyaY superfamily)
MIYRFEQFVDFIAQLPEERKEPITQIFQLISEHLPAGFEYQKQYSMPSFVVPHSKYPNGYHCDPKTGITIYQFASQKNFIALYHMGIYADPELYNWFVNEYPKHAKYKLDMGKSCIRFKKMNDIPYDLLKELFQKQTPEDWISLYERNVKG